MYKSQCTITTKWLMCYQKYLDLVSKVFGYQCITNFQFPLVLQSLGKVSFDMAFLASFECILWYTWGHHGCCFSPDREEFHQKCKVGTSSQYCLNTASFTWWWVHLLLLPYQCTTAECHNTLRCCLVGETCLKIVQMLLYHFGNTANIL